MCGQASWSIACPTRVGANLGFVTMKLKFWLVLLLAFILPVKGAMAAAGMLCHVPASQQSHLAHEQTAHPQSHAQAAGASHDAGHHHGTDPSRDGAADESCLACAAVCGASPLPATTGVELPVSAPVRDWRVSTLVEPPSLTLDGLERPPRSI